MEDVGAQQVPFMAIAAALHGLNHLHFGGLVWSDPVRGAICVATYFSLGE